MELANKPEITFIEQDSPVREYGRALYAVSRSILRALIDSLTSEDLTDLNCTIDRVTLRQLSKVVRLDRDKGMRGDGFEWAVHEAILGHEPKVIDPVAHALKKHPQNFPAFNQTLCFLVMNVRVT